jgi:hypothetical protein
VYCRGPARASPDQQTHSPLLIPHPPRPVPQYIINKKYTLPYLAIDAVAAHMLSLLDVPGPLPVIWHQSLLAFAERYKAELTAEQKERFKTLMHTHVHYGITPEVRRELFSVGCRGDAVAAGTGPAPAAMVIGGPAHAAAVAASAAGRVSKKAARAAMDVEY